MRVGAQALAARAAVRAAVVAGHHPAGGAAAAEPARRGDVDLVGRYLPATAGVDVGGDWYDVLELGGSTLLLVVGDVMGKGVPAATLMGQMRSAVRTLAAVDPDPAAILSGLDQLAIGFALDDIVTLVIVALDADTGTAVDRQCRAPSAAGLLPGRRRAIRRPPPTNTSPPIGVPVTRAAGQHPAAAAGRARRSCC